MAYGAIRGKTGGKDVGQWNPTTEQSAAFESATQGMSPAQKAQLSNLFRSVADTQAVQLGSSQRMGGTGKSPVQPGDKPAPSRVQQGEMGVTGGTGESRRGTVGQGEQAIVGNLVRDWLRTPEAQRFLGGGSNPTIGQGEMAMTGGGAPALPPGIGQGEVAMMQGKTRGIPVQQGEMGMTGGMGSVPFSPPNFGQGDIGMTQGMGVNPQRGPYPQGENLADQQLQKTLDDRAGLIAHIQGMMSQRPPRQRPQIGDYPPRNSRPAPMPTVPPRGMTQSQFQYPTTFTNY